MRIQYLIQLAVLLYCCMCMNVSAQVAPDLAVDVSSSSEDTSNVPAASTGHDKPQSSSASQDNDGVSIAVLEEDNSDTSFLSKENEGTPITTSQDQAEVPGSTPLDDTDMIQDTSKDNQDVPSETTKENNAVPSTSPNKATKARSGGTTRPHIVMIVADDLGWTDVSWRDKTMYTPVLAELASRSVVLDQAYVQPVCSPTRSAFMSGYYPYHTGLQHDSLRATQKAHLPDNITTLPQHLQQLGYSTHMAGKWHLGFCNWRYTPTYRGFDSFVGFYNAVQDYYTHIGHRNGYDFRHNKDVHYAANGTYSAYILTRYIEQVIAQHDVSKPLFVYLPYQSVHGPLEVPQYYIDKYCSKIQNETRRIHCGMVAALDEGVGNVTRALQQRGILNDTLLLFTTDNGGPVEKGANNWPLRGSKATLWEGGTRGNAFLHAPSLLPGRGGTTYKGMIHAVDWLPTLVEAAGGEAVTGLDGVSQWKSLVKNEVPSARTEFIYNIDELKKNAAIRQGKFKLLQGKPGHPDGWYPPPALTPQGLEEDSASSLENVNIGPKDESTISDIISDRISYEEASRLSDLFADSSLQNSSEKYSIFVREQLNIEIEHRDAREDGVVVEMTSENDVTKYPKYQLYDLEADPTERHDVKDKYPDVFKQMRTRLEQYRKSLVPANFPPHDPASFPSNFNGVWSPGWCK